jgi:hypothetical protein
MFLLPLFLFNSPFILGVLIDGFVYSPASLDSQFLCGTGFSFPFFFLFSEVKSSYPYHMFFLDQRFGPSCLCKCDVLDFVESFHPLFSHFLDQTTDLFLVFFFFSSLLFSQIVKKKCVLCFVEYAVCDITFPHLCGLPTSFFQ